MLKNSLQKILFYLFIVVLIFFLDRFSKIYILNLAELNNSVDIYLSSFLNLYLIWNKGIAFGLLSFEKNLIYNLITLLISVINIVIIFLIIKTKDIRVYFLIFILGGSLVISSTECIIRQFQILLIFILAIFIGLFLMLRIYS